MTKTDDVFGELDILITLKSFDGRQISVGGTLSKVMVECIKQGKLKEHFLKECELMYNALVIEANGKKYKITNGKHDPYL